MPNVLLKKDVYAGFIPIKVTNDPVIKKRYMF